MSGQSEKPWTEEEKTFLLTEILKKAGISSAFLFSIIKDNQISPHWMEIPLPQGRSLHSCQSAFARLENEYTQLYRQSYPGPPQHSQSSPGSRKRPLPPLVGDKGPRPIQPKPNPPGEAFPILPPRPAQPRPPRLPDPTRGEPPRKRGRPSKADIQRRTLQAQARGEQYPPPKRPIAKKVFGEGSPMMPGMESVQMQQQRPVQQQPGMPPHLPRHGPGPGPGEGTPFHQQGPRDEPPSQTEDIQARRMTGPHLLNAPLSVYGEPPTPVQQQKEPMPRTLEGQQMAAPPTAYARPPYPGLLQGAPGLPSPRQPTSMVPGGVGVETEPGVGVGVGVDPTHSIMGEQRET